MINEISVCILTKNEEPYIHLPIESVKGYVNEIIVIDDASTDNTKMIALDLGAKVIDLPVPVKKTGFAEAVNFAISSISNEWFLLLDADELLSEAHLLSTLIRYPEVDVWALPRRKWFNYKNKQRMEFWAYPDWQPKLFRAKPGFHFEGEMHIRFYGGKINHAYRGPHIEHLQYECRNDKKLRHRADLYKSLASKQGVEVKGGNIVVTDIIRGE